MINISKSGEYIIDLSFTHDAGDIDMYLEDNTYTIVGDSYNNGDREIIAKYLSTDKSYRLKLKKVSNAYSLTMYDMLKLSINEVINGQMIEGNNNDYYTINILETGEYFISVSFTHDAGDIDMYLYKVHNDGKEYEVNSSKGYGDAESIIHNLDSEKRYILRIKKNGNTEYNLVLKKHLSTASPTVSSTAITNDGTKLEITFSESMSLQGWSVTDTFHWSQGSWSANNPQTPPTWTWSNNDQTLTLNLFDIVYADDGVQEFSLQGFTDKAGNPLDVNTMSVESTLPRPTVSPTSKGEWVNNVFKAVDNIDNKTILDVFIEKGELSSDENLKSIIIWWKKTNENNESFRSIEKWNSDENNWIVNNDGLLYEWDRDEKINQLEYPTNYNYNTFMEKNFYSDKYLIRSNIKLNEEYSEITEINLIGTILNITIKDPKDGYQIIFYKHTGRQSDDYISSRGYFHYLYKKIEVNNSTEIYTIDIQELLKINTNLSGYTFQNYEGRLYLDLIKVPTKSTYETHFAYGNTFSLLINNILTPKYTLENSKPPPSLNSKKKIFLIGDSILDNSYWHDVESDTTSEVLKKKLEEHDIMVRDYTTEELKALTLSSVLDSVNPKYVLVGKEYVMPRIIKNIPYFGYSTRYKENKNFSSDLKNNYSNDDDLLQVPVYNSQIENLSSFDRNDPNLFTHMQKENDALFISIGGNDFALGIFRDTANATEDNIKKVVDDVVINVKKIILKYKEIINNVYYIIPYGIPPGIESILGINTGVKINELYKDYFLVEMKKMLEENHFKYISLESFKLFLGPIFGFVLENGQTEWEVSITQDTQILEPTKYGAKRIADLIYDKLNTDGFLHIKKL